MARKTRKEPLMVQEPKFLAQKVFAVGIYCRLSSEANERHESDSLEHQREMCMNYLQDRPDMQLIEVYMDNGRTGTNFDRPDFQRMLSDIQQKRIDCVIAKDLSRFGRNYYEVEEYLNLKFPQWGVRFISVLDHFDTSITDGNGCLIVPFRNILNEFYARDFSQKIQTAVHAKIKSGAYIPNRTTIPYGYFRDEDTNTIQPDPETATIVQQIFQWRAEGSSSNAIKDRLNQAGIPSPKKYQYLKGIAHAERFADTLWSCIIVLNILRNEVYLGHRIHYRNRANPQKQIRFEGVHQAIISEELFQQVQKVNRMLSKPRKEVDRSQRSANDYRLGLRGHCFCGNCGSKMLFEADNVRHYYLECRRYSLYREACTRHCFSMKKLIEIIEAELNLQISLLDTLDTSALAGMAGNGEEQTQLRHEQQSLLVRKQSLAEKKSQLLQDYIARLLDKEEYLYIKEQYEAAGAALEQELDALRRKLYAAQEFQIEVQEWREFLSRFQEGGHVTNELLKQLIERVDIFEKDGMKEVKLTFRYQDLYERVKGGVEDGANG